MSNIRYCRRCGNPLTEKSRFCDNCGAPVEAPVKSSQSGKSRNSNARQNQRMAGQNPNARQNQRMAGQNPNARQNQRIAGQNGNIRPNGAQPIPPYPGDPRKERYRQEELDRNWNQSWERQKEEEEDNGFTPVQYVLIGLMVLLLAALIIFTAFWIFGRSSNKIDSDRSSGQSGNVATEQLQDQNNDGNTIEILDGGRQQLQTETTAAVKTEKQTEKQTERQTEKQTETPADIVMNYPEFSLTIPGSWKGKYGVTQSANSFTYYHQGAKAQGYSGEFFTITCYKDTSYKSLSGAQVLGTGEGTAYVFTLPSGQPYPLEQQTIAEEYKRMNLDFGGISSRFRMLVSGAGPAEAQSQQIIEIQQSPNQQVEVQESANQQPQTQQSQPTDSSGGSYIAESSSRALTDADVTGMSSQDMQMAINEIYARHGRRFSSESIQSYFDSQSWYSGTVAPEDFSESVFSATEAQNIQFLLKKMGAQ